MSAAGFRVVVDGKRTGHLWNEYTTRVDAQAACSRLRAWGLDARVVAPVDGLETGSEIPKVESGGSR
jgi:hypothetical protein